MNSNLNESGRNFIAYILALGVCAGLLLPPVSSFFAPLVFPALFMLITFSLAIATDKPLAILTKPEKSVWGIMVWQMAFLPLLAVLVGQIADIPDDLELMLLATATSGSVFAAPTIAHLFRLDNKLPVNGMIISTFLMPISLLLFGYTLEGNGFDLSLSDYIFRVGMFLLVPLLLSITIHRVANNLSFGNSASLNRALQFGALIALLVFGIGIMDGVLASYIENPDRVLTFLVMAVGYGISATIGTIALFWSLGKDLVLAATILSAHRNVGLTYALCGTAIGLDFSIYVAICQLPMFLSPMFIHLIQTGSMAFRRASKEASASQPN